MKNAENGAGRSGRKAAKSSGRTPETAISQLAKTGALKAIGDDAIQESHALGLSVTVMEDGVIYRLHPDGTRTVKKRVAA